MISINQQSKGLRRILGQYQYVRFLLGKGRIRIIHNRERQEAEERDEANGVIASKSEISNEPMSESAATRDKGGEERKPESERRHQSHPDLVIIRARGMTAVNSGR